MRQQPVECCPACGSAGRRVYSGLRDRIYAVPGAWDFWRCNRCRSLWENPRPSDADLAACYTQYFTHDETSGEAPVAAPAPEAGLIKRVLLWGRQREQQRWSQMLLPSGAQGRLLEIGCGDGTFLARMRSEGWRVVGCELDERAAAVARERRRIEVVPGPFERQLFAPASFDAITMSHVIEHVPDPRRLLADCACVLRDGGMLSILTPNLGSLSHWLFKSAWLNLDPPRHLVLLSSGAIRRLVLEAGFEMRMQSSSARTVSGIFLASSKIEACGTVHGGCRQGQGIFDSLRRAVGVLVAHWATRLRLPIGEELAVVAVKRGRRA